MTTETTPARSSEMLTEQTLLNEAVELLLACLGSIPREKINPKQYWPHAQKALRIGAARGSTYERMVSEMHDQMMDSDHPFTKRSSKVIYSIGESLKARREYQRFRQLCRQNAPYIVVFARVRKEEQKQLNPYYWIDDTTDTTGEEE